MEFIKSKKIDLEGKLLVSIPSEGCLGQRVVDQILTNNKCFEFVGPFHHSSLQVIFGIPSLNFMGMFDDIIEIHCRSMSNRSLSDIFVS